MKKNIFLALSFALGLTMAVSCNQTQANNDTDKNNNETVAQANTPKEIEELANNLMSDEANAEIEKADKGEVVNIDEKTFNKIVAKGVVLVDFFATWCGPCKMQKPVLAEVAKENVGKITVGTVDTDKCPNLAGRYNIRSIPCMILFEDGKEVKRIIGYHDKQELMKELIGYVE